MSQFLGAIYHLAAPPVYRVFWGYAVPQPDQRVVRGDKLAALSVYTSLAVCNTTAGEGATPHQKNNRIHQNIARTKNQKQREKPDSSSKRILRFCDNTLYTKSKTSGDTTPKWTSLPMARVLLVC